MAYQGINTGSSPNSGTGDSLIEGAEKINSNFLELYNVVGNGTTLGVVTATSQYNTGIVTAVGGFVSGISTQAVKIDFSGNQLIFSVVGVSSTTLTLS